MRILIVKLSSIGDVVHTLPAAAALRRFLPGAHISWVVERRAVAVLKGSPVIDELIEMDTKAWRNRLVARETMKEVRAQLDRIRLSGTSEEIDLAIDFQGLIKSGLVALASGARRRIGFETSDLRERASRFFLTNQVRTVAIKHVIEKNLALARAAERCLNSTAPFLSGVSKPDTTAPVIDDAIPLRDRALSVSPPTRGSVFESASEISLIKTQTYEFPIAVSPEDEKYIDQALDSFGDRIAILNPGGGWSTKLWPATAYGEVADRLWNDHRLVSLVTYGPGEESLADAVVAGSRSGRSRAFPSTIKQFVALARRAKLFIGGDTGPLHLAAACRTPIVGIYGPTSPERNGPFDERDVTVGRDLWCRPECHRRKCWHWECLDIPVNAVIRAVSARLEEAGFQV